jgi:hypothetical protein
MVINIRIYVCVCVCAAACCDMVLQPHAQHTAQQTEPHPKDAKEVGSIVY